MTQKTYSPLNFCWATDSHNQDAVASPPRYYPQILSIYNSEPAGSPSKLRDALNQAVVDNCSFIALTGDVVESIYGTQGEATGYLQDVLDFIDSFGIERHLVLGNHDFPVLTRATWLTTTGKSGVGGTAYYSQTVGQNIIIIMDFNYDVNGDPYDTTWSDTRQYYFPSAERAWLQDTLDANDDKAAFIFTHQKVSKTGEMLGGAFLDIEEADGDAFRAICENHGRVAAVLQGHAHESDYSFINGIHYYTSQAMVEDDGSGAGSIFVEGASQNAYSIISVDSDGVFTITPYASADDQSAWTTKTFRIGGNMARQIKITVDSDKVAGNLADFPVLITEANMPNDFWKNVQLDGSDIWVQGEVSNEMTVFDSEVNYIDVATQKLELWIKVPALSGTVDTTFYINYGDTSLVQVPDTGVWDSDFASVHHMTELTFLDSTANGNTGTEGAAITSARLVDGLFGKATNFLVAATNRVDTAGSADYGFGTGAFTMEVLFKPNGFNASHHLQQILSIGAVGGQANDATVSFSPNGEISFKVLNWVDITGISPVLDIDTWYYLTCVREAGGAVLIYLDAVDITTGSPSEAGSIGNGASSELTIGAYHSTDSFHGNAIIGEVRISGVARTPDWITVTNELMQNSSSFYSAELWQVPTSVLAELTGYRARYKKLDTN